MAQNISKRPSKTYFTLNTRKVCAKCVPRLPTAEQEMHCRNICSVILQCIVKYSDLLLRIITCDDIWIFQYDLEAKREFIKWKNRNSPRVKNAAMSKFDFKAIGIVFFDIPQCQTVKQYYYLWVYRYVTYSTSSQLKVSTMGCRDVKGEYIEGVKWEIVKKCKIKNLKQQFSNLIARPWNYMSKFYYFSDFSNQFYY